MSTGCNKSTPYILITSHSRPSLLGRVCVLGDAWGRWNFRGQSEPRSSYKPLSIFLVAFCWIAGVLAVRGTPSVRCGPGPPRTNAVRKHPKALAFVHCLAYISKTGQNLKVLALGGAKFAAAFAFGESRVASWASSSSVLIMQALQA